MSEFTRFVKTYVKVIFCFLISDSLLQLATVLIDFLAGSNLNTTMNSTRNGLEIQLFFSLFGMTWIIRDGEFIDDIKASHWSQKEKYNNQSIEG
jgi:hypothetical protein